MVCTSKLPFSRRIHGKYESGKAGKDSGQRWTVEQLKSRPSSSYLGVRLHYAQDTVPIKTLGYREDENTPSTKIEDGSFLLPLKVFFCRLCSFESLVFEWLLSVVMFICWTSGLPIQNQKSLTQYFNGTIEHMHAAEHTKICWCIAYVSMLSTMKRARNDPIY